MINYKSFSKINLYLNIINQREDKFHNINSLVIALKFYDNITFYASSKYQLTGDGIEIPYDNSNLITKAYKLMRSQCDTVQEYAIHINKKIPIGAGLGGGSSNAATIINALNNLWKLNYSNKKKEYIGSNIGSDVPFFIKGGVQIVEGVGEKLIKCKYNPLNEKVVLLVIPQIDISTKWAYRKVNKYLPNNKTHYKLSSLSKKLKWNNLYNDFERMIVSTYPKIGKIKRDLMKSGAIFASLSGSGSTMFGIYDSVKSAKEAVRAFDAYQTILTFPRI